METDDPRATLKSKNLSERAAASRDLARHGSFDDVDLLLSHAMTDKSPSVRLYAAAAAADIVSRHRGAHGQPTLTNEQCEDIRERVRQLDPSVNPSVLMVLCAAADAASLKRLGRMAKDLRVGVRLGVTTTLRRVGLSAVGDRVLVERVLTEWFEDSRMPADVQVEMVRLAGEFGFTALADHVLRMAGKGDNAEEVSAEATDRLRARSEQACWSGLFFSNGLDIFEIAPEPRDAAWVLISDGEVVDQAHERCTFALVDGMGVFGKESVPMVWAPPAPATDYGPTLLWRSRAWSKVAPAQLGAFIEGHVDDFGALHASGLRVLSEQMAELDAPGTPIHRAAALVLAGDAAGATVLLQPLLDKAKPRADVYYWAGRASLVTGDSKAGVAYLEQYLAKARKKAPLLDSAKVLLSKTR